MQLRVAEAPRGVNRGGAVLRGGAALLHTGGAAAGVAGPCGLHGRGAGVLRAALRALWVGA